MKRLLVVLDFDGVLINSYALLRDTMAVFGLDIGDEERFRNRRKFLKYFGGGRELLNNLIGMSLPKTRKLRERLTEAYVETGVIYPEFIEILNAMIANPQIHCGIVSRNYTLRPGPTIRAVLRRSGVAEADLDFVVPIAIGSKKIDVLAAMYASRYHQALLCADELGDYRAAHETGYTALIGSYGFDNAERLLTHGEVPPACLYATPASLAQALTLMIARTGDRITPPAPQPLTAHGSAPLIVNWREVGSEVGGAGMP